MAKLSTYLTGVGGAQSGNLADPVAMQRNNSPYMNELFLEFCIFYLEYNQGQSIVPTGQYCVQITIERTVITHCFFFILLSNRN